MSACANCACPKDWHDKDGTPHYYCPACLGGCFESTDDDDHIVERCNCTKFVEEAEA